jgi:deazaflavin-dependent oxidoreductase (nitroreductase family)
MASMSSYPPTGLRRFAYKAPVWLYRANLGFLFGHRYVQLVTTGRKSGWDRDTVLEVVEYHARAGKLVVISGWGGRTDWYRNLKAGPALVLRLGTRRFPSPPHRFLDTGQTAMMLDRYRRAHPWAWRLLARGYEVDRVPTADQLDRAAAQVRGVVFDLPPRG